MFNDLLLSAGGGIISANQLAPQQGDACVMIGIGGTGIATLREVKRSVYNHLLPDNPDADIPAYGGIRFLAIDTDEKDLNKVTTDAKDLQANEQFSIKEPNLNMILKNPGMLDQEKNLSWMSKRGINMLGTDGAGGIRQVGRYCLMKKADDLKAKIADMINSVKAATGQVSVKIHIFAGISGGTGSGCFLDTCYIVRAALGGAPGSLFGYFFLPDIQLNRPGIAGARAVEDSNKRNGYAAFRELDYLMSLKESNEWFDQNYGGFTVHTQEPPVNLCHLISGTNAQGQLIPNAYEYGQKVVAEYILSYLTKVDGNVANDDTGLTSDGHLANVSNMVGQLKVSYGAQRNYHILGASSAELPLTHIGTYLAAQTYRKMAPTLGRASNKQICDQFAGAMGIHRMGLLQRLSMNAPMSPAFNMDLIERPNSLEDGENWSNMPSDIHGPLNAAMGAAAGAVEQNMRAQSAELDTYDVEIIERAENPSFAAEIFRMLVMTARNPEQGPTMAAEILHSDTGDDIINVLDGIVAECTYRKQNEELNRKNFQEAIKACANDYNNARVGKQKKLETYLEALAAWYRNELNIVLDRNACALAATLKPILNKMYTEYFAPLRSMLKELSDTFAANLQWLAEPEHLNNQNFCWRIFELEKVRDTLDQTVLRPQMMDSEHNDFVNYLFGHFKEWKDSNAYKISRCINNYMKQRFDATLSRTIDEFLEMKYGTADPTALADNVTRDILNQVISKAAPLFWRDENYVFNTSNTFSHNVLSVPVASTAITTAANNLQEVNLVVRKCLIGDRITCLCFQSGIPLFAYKGVYALKGAYDNSTAKGMHLREEDINWKTELPTPIPYRRAPQETPDGKAREDLYRRALELGVLCTQSPARPDDYVIRLLPDTTELVSKYTRDKYFRNGALLESDLTHDIEELTAARAALLPEVVPEGRLLELKNDGDADSGVAETVRMDYFVRFAGLRRAAQDSIRQLERIDDKIAEMNGWGGRVAAARKEVERFLFLMANGQITVENTVNIGISYTYRGIPESKVLCDFTFPFRAFPYYQAYKSIAAMEPIVLQQLDEAVDNMKKNLDAKYGPAIHGVVAEYTPERLGQIKVQTDTLTNGGEIMVFYKNLVDIAKELSALVPSGASAPAAEPAPRFEPAPAVDAAPAPAPAPAGDAVCPECGKPGPEGKFCPDCGKRYAKPAPVGEAVCPECGKPGPEGKFCPDCGKRFAKIVLGGEALCPVCGMPGPEGKFCSNCGERFVKVTFGAASAVCPNCGEPRGSGRFCPECGKPY